MAGRLYREVIMRQCPFDKQPEVRLFIYIDDDH